MKNRLFYAVVLVLFTVMNISAQNTSVVFEVENKGKQEKIIGEFMSFYMEKLDNRYSAIVVDNAAVQNAKTATIYLPNNPSKKYQLKDLSKMAISLPNSKYALIRLPVIEEEIKDASFFDDIAILMVDCNADVSDSDRNKEMLVLKNSWQDYLVKN